MGRIRTIGYNSLESFRKAKKLSSIVSVGDLNYWGYREDGVADFSSNTSFTSSTDGDVIVRRYTSLRIRSGVTVTTSARCRGLCIYVDGDALIEGTLTMTARGAYVPTILSEVDSNGLRFVRLKTGSTQTLAGSSVAGTGAALITAESFQRPITGTGKIYQIPRLCGTGAPSRDAQFTGGAWWGDGYTGGTVSVGCGGGGSGSNSGRGASGTGGQGTCFSGGAGSGGSNVISSNNASDYGGPGGAGAGTYPAGGGAGNPGGSSIGGDGVTSGSTGTGGLILLFVKGTLAISTGGVVSSNGMAGGSGGTGWPGGGGSGGGTIIMLYGGGYSNSGTVQANGGAGGTSASNRYYGGAGGAGSVTVEQIQI